MSEHHDAPHNHEPPDASDADAPEVSESSGVDRRGFLKRVGAAAAASVALPHLWIPRDGIAQTGARGEVDHLLYIRLSGGFRFSAVFNADVDEEFNPFGLAEDVPGGTEWGVSKLLENAAWLEGDDAAVRRDLGMQPVHRLADQIAVMPCVDHEPLAARADGNHGTGLERFYKGGVGPGTSFFTMINYGLRERFAAAREDGGVALPAFVLSGTGMAQGLGKYAGYRPPVLQGGFDQFGFDSATSLPDWAREMASNYDARMRDRQHESLRAPIDAYMQTREATGRYAEIFNSEMLKVGRRSDEVYDGLSNAQLSEIFGRGRAARNIQLALRLFHFGCPAVYLDQGGYDLHSGERDNLPPRIEELNRLISGLFVALKALEHPDGGSYWDHTLVVLGSEFGRTAGDKKFNSARGSDHNGDRATRWMSMPVFGGLVDRAGSGGRSFGGTRPADLAAQGKVYSYRALLLTLMDTLGCDHQEFFPADEPFDDLFA
jgi:hypothetical protein